jgi:hypothetical protein
VELVLHVHVKHRNVSQSSTRVSNGSYAFVHVTHLTAGFLDALVTQHNAAWLKKNVESQYKHGKGKISSTPHQKTNPNISPQILSEHHEKNVEFKDHEKIYSTLGSLDNSVMFRIIHFRSVLYLLQRACTETT